MKDYLALSCASRVYEVARQTPAQFCPGLSKAVGNLVYVKREDLQPQHSFKVRGAYNKMASLPKPSAGVVCASAGNHAQGVALAAKRLGIAAYVVMPETTPPIKTLAVRALGAETLLFGETYDQAEGKARSLAQEKRLDFIHPYDDPLVIAGQGTIGLELLRDLPQMQALFIPVGGGGLAAGVSAVIKAVRPEVKIIGVEPEDAQAMALSLAAGERVRLKEVGLFADGVAVRQVGEETFRICQQTLDGMELVDGDAICAAIKDIFDDTRAVLEPAGALALAGLKQHARKTGEKGKQWAAIASGANLNFDRLRHVAERAELGEGKEAIFAVTIPEQPGSFRALARLLGGRVITEFNYRWSSLDAAHVFLGVAVQDPEDAFLLLKHLRQSGLLAHDLSANEAAKTHLRHLVGGKSPVAEEVIYRFEFPERPGALLRFLDTLGERFNITLFHYRNHGADFGRVLAGFELEEKHELESHLSKLGYPFWDETGNEAVRFFLRG